MISSESASEIQPVPKKKKYNETKKSEGCGSEKNQAGNQKDIIQIQEKNGIPVSTLVEKIRLIEQQNEMERTSRNNCTLSTALLTALHEENAGTHGFPCTIQKAYNGPNNKKTSEPIKKRNTTANVNHNFHSKRVPKIDSLAHDIQKLGRKLSKRFKSSTKKRSEESSQVSIVTSTKPNLPARYNNLDKSSDVQNWVDSSFSTLELDTQSLSPIHEDDRTVNSSVTILESDVNLISSFKYLLPQISAIECKFLISIIVYPMRSTILEQLRRAMLVLGIDETENIDKFNVIAIKFNQILVSDELLKSWQNEKPEKLTYSYHVLMQIIMIAICSNYVIKTLSLLKQCCCKIFIMSLVISGIYKNLRGDALSSFLEKNLIGFENRTPCAVCSKYINIREYNWQQQNQSDVNRADIKAALINAMTSLTQVLQTWIAHNAEDRNMCLNMKEAKVRFIDEIMVLSNNNFTSLMDTYRVYDENLKLRLEDDIPMVEVLDYVDSLKLDSYNEVDNIVQSNPGPTLKLLLNIVREYKLTTITKQRTISPLPKEIKLKGNPQVWNLENAFGFTSDEDGIIDLPTHPKVPSRNLTEGTTNQPNCIENPIESFTIIPSSKSDEGEESFTGIPTSKIKDRDSVVLNPTYTSSLAQKSTLKKTRSKVKKISDPELVKYLKEKNAFEIIKPHVEQNCFASISSTNDVEQPKIMESDRWVSELQKYIDRPFENTKRKLDISGSNNLRSAKLNAIKQGVTTRSQAKANNDANKGGNVGTGKTVANAGNLVRGVDSTKQSDANRRKRTVNALPIDKTKSQAINSIRDSTPSTSTDADNSTRRNGKNVPKACGSNSRQRTSNPVEDANERLNVSQVHIKLNDKQNRDKEMFKKCFIKYISEQSKVVKETMNFVIKVEITTDRSPSDNIAVSVEEPQNQPVTEHDQNDSDSSSDL